MAAKVKAKAADKSGNGKVKATRLEIGQLIVTAAWGKTFSSGKTGFFGKAVDSHGTRYQIIGAVKLS